MANWTVSYGRYVQLKVTATEIDVDTANNRSKVRVQSSIYYPGGTSTNNAYPQTLSVNVNGTNIGTQNSITYSLSTGSRTKTLNTYTSGYITHNADGSKSVNVNVSITDNAGDNGNVNQTLVLTKIARASSLTSFSIGAHLKNGTANTVRLAISRQSTTFTHDIQLRDGSTVIQSWNGQGAPTSLTLLAASVNTLLNRMSSSTSKTLTLRVQTKSGSTNIGSALTRNATATVHADVKPTVSAMTVNISGNGRDKTISKYVQGFSRVAASFTRSAGYGASITSSSIVVRRRSGAADSQTINSNDGTTGRAVALNGLYEIRGTARDSRGRTTSTVWATITVDAYSTPVISKFSVDRNVTTATTANATITGGHSHLSGQNPLTLKLEKRLGTGAWTNVPLDTTATSTTATFSRTAASTGNNVARSYEFRLSLSDTFGARVEASRTVSTQRVVLGIHKNEGVGIGKIHEKGVLDVDGSAYFAGDVEFSGGLRSTSPVLSANRPMSEYPLGISMFAQTDLNGFPEGFHTAANFYESIYRSGQLVFGLGGRNLYFRGYHLDSGWSDFTKVAGIESGTNSNGGWVIFNDGIQIVWENGIAMGAAVTNISRTFSKSFSDANSIVVLPTTSASNNQYAFDNEVRLNRGSVTTSGCSFFGKRNNYQSAWVDYIAIGRWKQ